MVMMDNTDVGILEILGRDSSIKWLSREEHKSNSQVGVKSDKKAREGWNHTRLHVEIKPNFI